MRLTGKPAGQPSPTPTPQANQQWGQQYPLYPPEAMPQQGQVHGYGYGYGYDPRAMPPPPPYYDHAKPRSRLAIKGVAVLVLTIVSLWLWQTREAAMHRLWQASADLGLELQTISVNGRVNISHADILAAVNKPRGTPLFAVDLQGIHSRLMHIGWVESVRVERHFPNTLAITIQEKQALAIYQDSTAQHVTHHVIDRKGQIIDGVRLDDFRHLPVVSGVGAASKAEAVIEMLRAEPNLYGEVWSLSLQSTRRWDVFLKNNIRVKLPEHNIAEAWQRLAAMEVKHGLTKRDITTIDLRVPGRIILRLDKPTPSNTAGAT